MKANLVKTSLDKPLIEHSGVSVESLSTEYSKPSYGDAPAPHSAGCISVLSSRSRGALAKGDGTSEERSSLTGAFCPDSSPGSAEATGKRKEHPKFTGSRFKAVAHVVLAMKRFQASINPTVTFGKPPSSNGGSASSSGAVASAQQQGLEATSPRLGPRNPDNASKLQRCAHSTSRNRFAMVMQPLADEP
mmetsp:Transcript_13118/g.39705  ORF Transcript_13118/g.39705 Transcript_13118/m.39705 type:complete len:190 (+) Transcript_13118:171-740(+)|eukprot:CAMPEP_0206140470 /NCGR_PEP_ID=MMETSP1473-20131121/9553_1 /ASSEMBLY_ACC=CAM_ASM_001109 /TAXON_ID=1461547 /ORGANISM="Stichococcus sp, Strain RCC1054" /LENGTH=189 /DNA_ID=CAMNT_0053534629 /DNA_START=140 /DNA_END=709 /DNA_ORIENTATION=+